MLSTRRLRSRRVQPLQPGVRLTAIFDSCHSGSALDLPYIYSTQGVLKEPNLAKEAGQGLLNIVSSYARGDLGNIASTAMGFFKKATTGDEVFQRNLRTKTSPADVIMWSGSKDDQTSYVDPIFPAEPDFFLRNPVLLKEEDETCHDSVIIKTEEAPDLPFRSLFEPHRDIAGHILI